MAYTKGLTPRNDISVLLLRNFRHTFDKNCHKLGIYRYLIVQNLKYCVVTMSYVFEPILPFLA